MKETIKDIELDLRGRAEKHIGRLRDIYIDIADRLAAADKRVTRRKKTKRVWNLSWTTADPCPAFNSVKFNGLLGPLIWWFRLRRAGCKNVTISRYRGKSREELIRRATYAKPA